MTSNPLKWLLVLVAGVSLLSAFNRARGAGRRELPSIVIHLVWAALAIGALLTTGPLALGLSVVVVVAGLFFTELLSVLRSLLLRARLGGRYRRARLLALVRAVLAPSALNRTVYQACVLLDDQDRGRLSPGEANLILDRAGGPLEQSVLAGALVEGWLVAGSLETIARWFDEVREGAMGVPPPAGVAVVTALGALGRLTDAGAAVAYLDGHLVISAAPDPDDLAELDHYRTKAWVIFLAHTGHGALVNRLWRESGAMRRLFHPREAARIRAVWARARPTLDPATAALAERIAAAVLAQSALAGTPVSRAAWPWATTAIAALCVLVYGGVALTSATPGLAAFGAASTEQLVTWGAFRADLVLHGDTYRLFASTWLHAHILHLFANVSALAALGAVVEHLLGRWRFLLVYLVAGLAGSAACLAYGQKGIMVGASGAVCGVMGAGIVLLRGLQASSPAGWHQRQTKIFRGAAIGTALLGALLPFVSNAAHAGGFVAGALVTAALGRPVREEASPRWGWGAVVVASAWLLLGGLSAFRIAERLQVPAGLRHAQYLESACDAGDAGSCFAAGIAYHLGQGVPRAELHASRLYQRACDGGDAGGCNNLGVLYASGAGVPKDDARAVELYQRGCEAGDDEACNNLGSRYEHGAGVAQDEALARKLYRKACDGGSKQGCEHLRRLGGEGPAGRP